MVLATLLPDELDCKDKHRLVYRLKYSHRYTSKLGYSQQNMQVIEHTFLLHDYLGIIGDVFVAGSSPDQLVGV